MADEEEKEVVVTLDDASDGTPDASKLDAEGAGKTTEAADAAADGKERHLTAEEGKEDLAAQLKAAQDTAAAERAAREKAEREAQEARETAKSAHKEVLSRDEQLLANGFEAVKAQQEQAKGDYIRAMETGDYGAAAEAQNKMALAASRMTHLEAAKAAMDARKGRPANPHEGRVEQPRRNGEQDAFEEYVGQLSPASQAWMRRHPQCVNDPKMNRRTIAAHNLALAEDIQPDTPQYFQFIEEHVGLREALQKDTGQERQVQQRGAPRPAAPPNRDGGGGSSRLVGNRITLSPAEREAARISGLTEQEYARQLLKAERNGEIGAAAANR